MDTESRTEPTTGTGSARLQIGQTLLRKSVFHGRRLRLCSPRPLRCCRWGTTARGPPHVALLGWTPGSSSCSCFRNIPPTDGSRRGAETFCFYSAAANTAPLGWAGRKPSTFPVMSLLLVCVCGGGMDFSSAAKHAEDYCNKHPRAHRPEGVCY